jgi:uncharacterized protein
VRTPTTQYLNKWRLSKDQSLQGVKIELMDSLKVPVLPIPNIVFFPNTAIPLHLVEPVYVKMARDCIQTESHMAISLAIHLGNGLESKSYYTPKNICSIGKPIILEELFDGSMKVLVRGTGRVKLQHLIQNLPYPVFEASTVPDKQESETYDGGKVQRLKAILDSWLITNVTDSIERENFSQNIQTIHQVVDYICMFLVKDKELKQVLLETDSLFERIQMLNLLFSESRPHNEDAHTVNILKHYEILEKVATVGH